MKDNETSQFQSIWSGEIRSYLMGLAILGVVGVHLSGWIENVPQDSKIPFVINFLFSKGDAGVNIFFLLSSYGLCFSYLENSLSEFYVRRIKRLFPTYLLSQLYAVIIGGISVFLAAWQMTGIPYMFGTKPTSWYLEATVILYLVFPLIFYVIKKIIRFGIVPIIIACFGISFISDFCSNYFLQLFISRIPMIIIGVSTFHLLVQENSRHSVFILYGVVAIGSFMSLFELTYLAVPGILLLLSYCKYLPLRRIVCYLGNNSLPIYLVHTRVINSLTWTQDNYHVNIILVIVITLVISEVVSLIQKYTWVFYDFVNLKVFDKQ